MAGVLQPSSLMMSLMVPFIKIRCTAEVSIGTVTVKLAYFMSENSSRIPSKA